MNLMISMNSDVETYLSTPKSPAENASGHQFLQPRVSSGSATRRNTHGNIEGGNIPTNSPYSVGDPSNRGYTYQPVLDEESSNLARQGVAVPIHQRIIEGFPVVPLSGLVAHEVCTTNVHKISFHVSRKLLSNVVVVHE